MTMNNNEHRKSRDVTMSAPTPAHFREFLSTIHSTYCLDDLLRAIELRRRELLARRLELLGFVVTTKREIDQDLIEFAYAMVALPDRSLCAWATASEMEHLLDFAANLTPREAMKRWLPHVTPFYEMTDAEIAAETQRFDADERRLVPPSILPPSERV